MYLHDLAAPTGQDTFHSPVFRNLIESHYLHFFTAGYVKGVTIDGQLADKHHGDFFGLLDTLKIPKAYHWAFLFFNHYRHPGDFNRTTTLIVSPDTAYLDLLMQLYRTRKVLL
ncbi:MAG: hypothetical protein ACR2HF_08995 [Methylococcaceae bacterium]